jgi:tetratricopeptide (TPR) repeat protein
MRHVDFEFLNRFVRGELAAEGALRMLLGHIAESCPECRMALDLLVEEVSCAETSLPLRPAMMPVCDLAGLRAALPDPRFVGALDKLEAEAADWARRVRAEKKRARADLRLLRRLPPEERAERIRTARSRFRSRAFAELLLAEARRLCRNEPAEAANLAELVPVALLWLPGAEGQPWARELEVRAAAWQANALRVAGRIRRADTLFAALRVDVARQPLKDPAIEAEAASLEASLRCDQGRLNEARDLLRRADTLFRLEHDAKAVARVAIKRGVVEQQEGDLPEAAACYREALAQVGPAEDAYLFLSSVFNLVLVLSDEGRYGEAEQLLDTHQGVYRGLEDAWWRPLERWRRGRIAAGLGRADEAEAAFLEARSEYAQAGDGIEAALVSLDLALLYLEQGRTAELKQVARLMQDLFAAEGLGDRALAALALFQQAVAAETVTVAAIRTWRRQIERTGRVGSEDRVA